MEGESINIKNLKPCDICGGPIKEVFFYRLRIQQAVLDTRNLQTYMGMNAVVGSAALADVFMPSDRGAVIMNEREVVICAACALNTDLSSAILLLEEQKSE